MWQKIKDVALYASSKDWEYAASIANIAADALRKTNPALSERLKELSVALSKGVER